MSVLVSFENGKIETGTPDQKKGVKNSSGNESGLWFWNMFYGPSNLFETIIPID